MHQGIHSLWQFKGRVWAKPQQSLQLPKVPAHRTPGPLSWSGGPAGQVPSQPLDSAWARGRACLDVRIYIKLDTFGGDEIRYAPWPCLHNGEQTLRKTNRRPRPLRFDVVGRPPKATSQSHRMLLMGHQVQQGTPAPNLQQHSSRYQLKSCSFIPGECKRLGRSDKLAPEQPQAVPSRA